MTGMGRGVGIGNPLVLTAFHTSLLHQLLIVLALVVVLALAWNVARTIQFRRAAADGQVRVAATVARLEPRARLVLRLAFGALWTLDGLLQLQPAMPLGLPGGVISPSADGAPSWVHHVVDVGVTLWSNHPITAATSAVWIQLGIGIGLLVAPRGWWSRAAGAASAGWGLVVWVFGESFGGLFTPGGSWLFGLPGAAIFYVAAGALLVLPEARWQAASLGRWLLRGLGLLFVGLGVLQAWPGRATWAGQPTPHATPGLTTAMVQQMAQVSQPRSLVSVVRWFAGVDAAHGWAVNLVVVLVLLGVGSGLLTGQRRFVTPAVVVGVVACLADWVLIQDLGFFGGEGTDPNSMLPIMTLLIVGYMALVAPAAEPLGEHAEAPDRSASYLLRVAAAIGAVALVLLGAAPMAVASTNPHADTILTTAINGTPVHTNIPSWGFTLTDQHGRRVTLSQFHGRVVVLTFLDPVCSTDCPLLAQELLNVNHELAGTSPSVVFVAVDANPTFRTVAALRAFDAQEGLASVANWEYVTGSLDQLAALWDDYDVEVQASSGGGMSVHQDRVYVLSTTGRIRSVILADPGDSTATASSLATLVRDEVQRVQST